MLWIALALAILIVLGLIFDPVNTITILCILVVVGLFKLATHR